MKIIALILTVSGMVISGISSLAVAYSMHSAVSVMKNAETSGIGRFAEWFDRAQTLNYINIFGVVILFFGVVLIIISMFTVKKQQITN